MFSTIRPYIIYIILYILHWHTENTSLPNGPFIYSVGSWPGTKLWAIVRRQKYQHPHCLPAHPKDTTQWPDKTCISKAQPQSMLSPYRSEALSILSLMYLRLPSLFLPQLVKQQLDSARLSQLSQLSSSGSTGSTLLSPQNSAMEVPWWDSNKTLWPRVHAFELNKPGKWSRNSETSQFCKKFLSISCCNSVYHWYLLTVSILLHF